MLTAIQDTVPVKVVIERDARPGAEDALRLWAEGLVTDFTRSPGHEGSTVLSAPGSRSHVILLRFASAGALEAWEQSPAHRQLMQDADELSTAGEALQVRSGLDAWFTLPDQPVPMRPPPKWKMALTTWLGLLPLVIGLAYALAPLRLPFPMNSAVSTLLTVILLTWVVMPRLTHALSRWLYAT